MRTWLRAAHHLHMLIEQISTTVMVFENGSFDNEIFLFLLF
jgi:hypothetical protein